MIPQTALTLMRELTAVEERIAWAKSEYRYEDMAIPYLARLNRDRKRLLRKLLENPPRNP